VSNEVTIDLSDYKDKVGQRVMPGKYRVVVDDAEQDVAKSGNTMITLWLRVLDGEFAGSVVLDRLVLTPNSLFRVVGFMQAIGMPTPKKRLKINLRQFIGRTLEVEVDDGEPWQGKTKSEVRSYNRPSHVEVVTDLEPGNGQVRPTEALVASLAASDDGAVDLDSLDL